MADFTLRDLRSQKSTTLQKLVDAALFAYQNGNLVEAERICERVLTFSPKNVAALQMMALISLAQGRFAVAVELYRRVIKLDPKLPAAYLNLGIAFKALGKIDLALKNYDRAIALNSRDEKSHFNRANALSVLEQFDEAIVSYGTSINLNPTYAEAHCNLGNALCKKDKTQDAIASYDMAISLKSDYVDAYVNRGTALMETNRLDEALASFDKAIAIKPDCADAHNNRGIALMELNRLDEARTSYLKAVSVKPDFASAYASLCQLYELQNNLEELEKVIEIAQYYCAEDNVDILFRRAQLASRKNQFDVALGYLEKLQVQKLQPSLRVTYFNLLGKTYDSLEQFDNAFSAFEKQNELVRDSFKAQKFRVDQYLNSLHLRKAAWITDVKPVWAHSMIGGNQTSPTFLIGFPRSGTTLLDTILSGHPKIAVVEEMPMVQFAHNAFSRTETIQNFNTILEADLLSLREVYFEELRKHLDLGNEGKLVVDKFPLNIAHVGFIHRVFPDAKFILALRHPCDCVLSCFMQNFKLNSAMVNFLSLEQAAKVYAAIMELWFVFNQKLNLNVHMLKYEDLIQNFEGQCQSLIRFLGVDWDDNLYSYQKTALNRAMIRTPSYSQVIQPLYKKASGRWTNYQKQMQPVLPVLRPWIEAFGY
ncbi:MAG: tetratricopeptide repeat protein [Candidatus Nitrotoga sp.]